MNQRNRETPPDNCAPAPLYVKAPVAHSAWIKRRVVNRVPLKSTHNPTAKPIPPGTVFLIADSMHSGSRYLLVEEEGDRRERTVVASALRSTASFGWLPRETV